MRTRLAPLALRRGALLLPRQTCPSTSSPERLSTSPRTPALRRSDTERIGPGDNDSTPGTSELLADSKQDAFAAPLVRLCEGARGCRLDHRCRRTDCLWRVDV